MKKILIKITALFVVLFLFVTVGRIYTFADVFSEKAGAGSAETVYVAGNPDLYPIEYYDPDVEFYRGVIPDILEIVSHDVGIDFTYISAGSENLQKDLCKNNQVELLTAISVGDNEFEEIEECTVLSVDVDGKTVNYGIGFTKIASDELKLKIKNALSNISDSRKMGLLIDITVANTEIFPKWLALTLSVLCVAFLTIILVAIYIHIRKNRKRKIANIDSMLDKVTGIGNAEYYVYAFENLISAQTRNLYTLAYISFDIKAFEKFHGNNSLADVERYTAEKLKIYITATDYISRIGDGTFAILFQAENAKVAENKISEILSGINEHIKQFVFNYDVLFQAGYCRLCEHSGIDAEGALYNAKQGYLYAAANCLSYYVGSGNQIARSKRVQKLSSQINNALENGEFKIYMQLISDCETGVFCGAEALSRWQNKEYGMLRPQEYIDILNSTGRVVEHDYKIFENVCAQLETWDKTPFDKLFLTCNFTRISVSRDDFSETLKQIAQKYKFSPERIVIEITEDSLGVNPKTVSKNIRQCRKFGFRVAIDDMGTGFSSLSDIYDNKIDIVKIEKNFVSACATERHQRMLGDIISLVHNTGALVVCEGVENVEQLELIKNINCDMMQGFYNSRVLPVSECEKLILKRLGNNSL